jgi:hypothetical protein
MPLHNGLQIVLQYLASGFAPGSIRCRGFKGFALKSPAFVAETPRGPNTSPASLVRFPGEPQA